MSTTRNVLDICDKWTRSFRGEFGFFLDYLDELIRIQSAVGFERDELTALIGRGSRPREDISLSCRSRQHNVVGCS